MAVKVKTRNGGTATLLNPSEKGKKFVTEIKTGIKQTNDGFIKKDEFNRVIELGKQERAYRSGYLDAQKDSANCYKAQKAKEHQEYKNTQDKKTKKK